MRWISILLFSGLLATLQAADVASIGDRTAAELELTAWSKIGTLSVASAAGPVTYGYATFGAKDGNFQDDFSARLVLKKVVIADGVHALDTITAGLRNVDASSEEFAFVIYSDDGSTWSTVIATTNRTTGSDAGDAEVSETILAADTHNSDGTITVTNGAVWVGVFLESGSSRLYYTNGADTVETVILASQEAVNDCNIGDTKAALANGGSATVETTKTAHIRFMATAQ